jgi:hypothetical protein
VFCKIHSSTSRINQYIRQYALIQSILLECHSSFYLLISGMRSLDSSILMKRSQSIKPTLVPWSVYRIKARDKISQCCKLLYAFQRCLYACWSSFLFCLQRIAQLLSRFLFPYLLYCSTIPTYPVFEYCCE